MKGEEERKRFEQLLHRPHRSAPREVLKNPCPALASPSVTISVMSSSLTRGPVTAGLDASDLSASAPSTSAPAVSS